MQEVEEEKKGNEVVINLSNLPNIGSKHSLTSSKKSKLSKSKDSEMSQFATFRLNNDKYMKNDNMSDKSYSKLFAQGSFNESEASVKSRAKFAITNSPAFEKVLNSERG